MKPKGKSMADGAFNTQTKMSQFDKGNSLKRPMGDNGNSLKMRPLDGSNK